MSTVTMPVGLTQADPTLSASADVPGRSAAVADWFHASPELLEPGVMLVPGDACKKRTTHASTGGGVSLAGSLEDARGWAVYIGQRCDADRVGIYRARAQAVPVEQRVGDRPWSELVADRAVVLGLVEWVNPWVGAPTGYRETLREIPF